MTDLGFMNCRKKGSPFKYLFLLKGTPFDEQTQAAAEKREDLNLGTESEPKIVLISGTLSPAENDHLVAILLSYVDVFAWSL